MPNFLSSYTQVVAAASSADFTDNHDSDRFGPPPSDWRALAGAIRSKLETFGPLARRRNKSVVLSGSRFVEPHLADLEWLYSHLADEESRRVLIDVIAFRALGHRRIKLPLNCPEHWARISSMKTLAAGSETIESGFNGWKLQKMDLSGIGYPIRLFLSPGGVVTDFIEQQYRCETADGPIECSPGDTAIDAGACWGDTALYLAHKAGPEGRVAAFEFLPQNLQIYEKNLALNPELAKRIRLFKNPVWSSGGEELFVNANGPATSVCKPSNSSRALKVLTVCIDDILAQHALDRVDFLKMDIEGAELAALQGAAHTLRKFRPRLAVTVYHRLDDFWTIPRFLDHLAIGYRFYLRHFTIHSEETVLFATAAIS